MNNEVYYKRNRDLLIGILLIMPIYMLVFIVLNMFNLNKGDNSILLPTLMYCPIIIGIFLSYKFYKNKVNKTFGYIIIAFCILSLYFYYNTYFVEQEGWNGIGQYFLWLINTAISKIMACVFYGKIVGHKKALIFLGIYALIVILSFVLGFWA